MEKIIFFRSIDEKIKTNVLLKSVECNNYVSEYSIAQTIEIVS